MAIERVEAALKLCRSAPSQSTSPVEPLMNAAEHIAASLALCRLEAAIANEPIRTLHHFSCTGGTLFAKCVASMANVLVLNEIDPHSPLGSAASQGTPAFTPTDMISLLRQADPNLSGDMITELFLHDIAVIRDEQAKIGRRVVLRDHSHGHFLTGETVRNERTLQELVAEVFPVRSVVTVRHPADSYASMEKRNWHRHFAPSSFAEYCGRYEQFLDRYHGVPIIRYEDLTAEPEKTMTTLCKHLDLPFNSGFETCFNVFKFSGDSGRKADTIVTRPGDERVRQRVSHGLGQPYRRLLDRLGYHQ